MTAKRKVPVYKIKAVKELKDLTKSKKTILVASIKNIPGSQFQEIVKKLRGKAIVKVPKKRLILMALDSENEEIKKLRSKIDDSFAILFSDLDSYELAGELINSTSPAKAKPGQEAPEDIEVEAGGTDLVPGPAISELGALGIQIQIEKGKIHIKESKVIAKKGAKISKGAADLMTKLDIKPFKIGFIPLCSFDTQENKLYEEINIDREGTITELKESYSKALAFSVEIGYATEDTIRFLLQKAERNAKVLENLEPSTQEKISKEDSSEDNKKLEEDAQLENKSNEGEK